MAAVKLARLRRLRELRAEKDRIAGGVAAYYDDPVGFARDCVIWPEGEGLAGYQEAIIAAVPERHRVCVRGPHGLGKTAVSAIIVLWFVLTREARGVDWKVGTTAGAWHQLVQYTWPEIHKWAGRLRWDVIRQQRFTRAELQNLNLKLSHGNGFAAASKNAALIEGAHAEEVLFLFDESKAIPPGTFDAVEGAFSTGVAYALAISTPGEPSGRFYEIQSRKPGYEDWHTVHVTAEQAIAAGRMSQEWAEARRRQWGEQSALYHNRVLGEFHAGDEDSVIPLAWAEAAVDRWRDWDAAGRPEPAGRRIVGVDVARYGQDKTVRAVRQGNVVQELLTSVKEDTMATVARVQPLLDWPHAHAVVDVVGIGAGVYDRLLELGCSVSAFSAGSGTPLRDSTGSYGFADCRSAAWWQLREALDPSAGPDLCLPPDDDLLTDLTAPKYTYTTGRPPKIKVEPKDAIRERIGRSTDFGDAVVQSLWQESAAGRATAVPYGVARRVSGNGRRLATVVAYGAERYR